MAITFNHNDKFYINGSNVGIGTDSPNGKLDIVLDSIGGLKIDTNSDGGATITTYQGSTNSNVRQIEFNVQNFQVKTGIPQGTSTTDALFIDSSQNVGIGTTSPTRKLHVSAGSGYAALFDSTNRYKLGLAHNGTEEWWFAANSNGSFAIHENNVGDQVTVLAGGNVGIGTTSPTSLLEIHKDNTSGQFATYRNNTGFFLHRTYADYNNDGAIVEFQQRIGVDGNYSRIGNFSNHPLYLMTNNSTNMTLLTNGNVGIGTTSPENRLHLLTSTTDTTQQLLIQNGSTGDAAIKFNISGKTYSLGIDNSDDDKFKLSAGNLGVSDRLVVDSAGNVGIGTTSPAYKLHVIDSTANGRAVQGIQTGTSGTNYGAVFTAEGGGATKNVGLYANAEGATTNYAAILNNGLVGIGTTSPLNPLHVYSATINKLAIFASGDNGGLIQINDNDTYSYVGSEGSLTYIGQTASASANNLVINASGNVGIGTTSPDAPLTVHSSTDPEIRFGYSSTQDHRIQWDSSKVYIHADPENANASSALGLYVDGSARLYIPDSGNVGIGTTSPSAKLDIYGDSNSADNMIELINSKYDSTNTSGETGILFGWNNHVAARITAFKEGTVNRTGFKIVGEAGFNVATTIATFRSTGRVGIGTTNPSAELDVVGNTRLGPDSEHAFQVTDDSTNNFLVLSSTQRTTASAARDIKFRSYGTDATDNVLVMDMSAGNVGIGTNSPNTFLHIAGQGNRSGGQIYLGNQDDGSTKYSLITSAHYNAATEPEGFTLITGLSTATENTVSIGGFVWESNPATDIRFFTHTATTHTTGGSERMRIISNGNVGIGTTSPSQKLEVSGTIRGEVVNVYGSTNPASTSPYLFSPATGALGIGANGSERMRITSTGNVGIGTTSPSSKFHIKEDNAGGLISKTENPNTGTGAYVEHSLDSGNLDRALRIGVAHNYAASQWNNAWVYAVNKDLALKAGSSGKSIKLYTGGTTENEVRAIIDSSGNVGIGTTSPNGKLQVDGDIYVNGADKKIMNYNGAVDYGTLTNNSVRFNTDGNERLRITGSGNVGIGTTSPTHLLSLSRATQAAAYQLNINNVGSISNGNFTGIRFSQNSSATTELGNIKLHYFSSGATDLSFGTRYDTQALYIKNGGNVGIGTTSPGAKLTIKSPGDVDTYGDAFVVERAGTTAKLVRIYEDAADGFLEVRTGADDIVTKLSGYSGTPSYFLSNVGIGTTSPNQKLHVEGAIYAGTANSTSGSLILVGKYNNGNIITIGGGYGGGGAVIGYGVKPSTTAAGAFLSSSALASLERSAYVQYGSTHQWWTGAYQTVAVDSAATLSQVMTLDGAGNLGVGTTSPAGRLELNGSGQSWSTAPAIRMWDSFNSKGWLVGNVNNITAGDFYIRTLPGEDTNPGASNNEFTIKHATGNVGIGTTTPSYKFTVSSGTDDIGILTASSDSGSYVGFLDNATSVIPKIGAVGNKLVLDANNIGVGTTSPSYQFQIDNDALNTNNPALYVRNPNSSTAAVIAEFVGDSDSIQIKNINVGDYAIYNTQQSNGIALYDGNGGVEIHYNGATVLEADSNGGVKVTGQLSATGDVVAYSSDERLKENIKPIENAVDKIKQLKGVTFDWNEKSQELGFEPSTKTNDVGVIAQDVEAVFPQLVHLAPFDIGSDEEGKATSKTGEDYKTVNYARLTAVLIEAVKEQQQQIDELKEIINGLTK